MYSRLYKYFAFLRNSVYMTTEVPGQSGNSMAIIHEEPADRARTGNILFNEGI